jgi:transcriptional regulator with XRE-family HTH domain
MIPLQRRLGKAVRRLRAAAGFSQESFADHVGVHRTTMGRIERGAFNLTLETLERVAKGLRMPASALLAEAEAEGRRGPRTGAGAAPATAPDHRVAGAAPTASRGPGGGHLPEDPPAAG